MVEVRTFEGAGSDLHAFVVDVWRQSYAAQMSFPLWTAEYFDWQFGLNDDVPRDHLIAAYDGSRLVGTLLGFSCRFRLHGETFGGSQGSWLSVAPEYRRSGVASQLREELRRRHREQNLRFQVGFGYFGSRHSLGPAFWSSQRKKGTTFLKKVGFWARVLRVWPAAQWSVSPFDRALIGGLGWLQLPPMYNLSKLTIRPFDPRDLSDCSRVIRDSHEALDFALIWDDSHLERQLEGRGVGKTLVAEVDGTVQGLVNYHCLPFLGRTEETVAVIDIIAASPLSWINQHRLICAALLQMKEEGAILALKLRICDYDTRPFWTTGFIPRLADSHVMLTWGDEPQPVPAIQRMHLLWR